MRKERKKAEALRRQGKSYRQIRDELKVPLATLSTWFGGEEWSKKVAARLRRESASRGAIRLEELNSIRGESLVRAYDAARKEARLDFERLKYHPLFIAGLTLYLAEGTKSETAPTTLTSTEPQHLKLYILFLSEICRIPLVRIKARLMLYPDLEEMVSKAYWSKQLGIPWHAFKKGGSLKPRKGLRKLNWGVCSISVSSTYFKVKMLEWLRILPGELMNREYYANIGGTADAE